MKNIIKIYNPNIKSKYKKNNQHTINNIIFIIISNENI